MLLPHKDRADLIREVARQACESKDKSLFGLLLLLEEQISGGAVDRTSEKSGTSVLLEQRSPLLATRSRYIE
jgi:hypothetical protein